jgi:Fic family protein
VEEQKSVELTEPPAEIINEKVPAVEKTLRKKRITQEQIQEMVNLFRAGHSRASLGRMFNVSNPTVSYYIKKFS